MAWQFNRPETGEGMVQAFRRKDSVYESARFKLKDLDSDALYLVADVDEDKPREMTGQELMGNGLLVSIANAPGAVVTTYKRLR
jgi:alpha-galactosidase